MLSTSHTRFITHILGCQHQQRNNAKVAWILTSWTLSAVSGTDCFLVSARCASSTNLPIDPRISCVTCVEAVSKPDMHSTSLQALQASSSSPEHLVLPPVLTLWIKYQKADKQFRRTQALQVLPISPRIFGVACVYEKSRQVKNRTRMHQAEPLYQNQNILCCLPLWNVMKRQAQSRDSSS